MIIDAIRFSFSLDSAEGFLFAKDILDGETSQIDVDMQLLRYKLLVAVQDGDIKSANETWLQLGICNVKECKNLN